MCMDVKGYDVHIIHTVIPTDYRARWLLLIHYAIKKEIDCRTDRNLNDDGAVSAKVRRKA